MTLSRTAIGRAARGLLYAGFTVWFGLTVAAQRPFNQMNKVRKVDPLGLLIANWCFFAPNPGVHDYHLLYRDKKKDGEYTDWQEVGGIEERKIRHVLYHPNRRFEKSLYDIGADLLAVVSDLPPDDEEAKQGITLAVAYLALINYIDGQCHHVDDAVACQFLMAASAGYDDTEEPAVLFLSEAHPLTSSQQVQAAA